MVKLIFGYLFLFEITVKQILKILKKAISTFNWTKALENFSMDGKVELLNKILLNINRNYISNKKIKYNFRQLP